MIKTTQKIKLYNLDNEVQASKWVREEIKGLPTFDAPQMSSGINVKQNGRGKVVQNYIGYFQNNANSPYYNTSFVSMFSGNFSGANGLSIIPENYMKVVALFTARRSIKRDWINWQDEYSQPNTDHEYYAQWNNDAIIYSLFNTKSNQSSLRDIEYKGKIWQIENEFFFMSHEEIKELADENSYGECYNDVKQYGKDRYVYKKLKEITLSEDAQDILDMAREMVRKTFEYREMMNEEHPNYNLQSWDAGWYQVKLIAKEYMKDELKEFSAKYKEFEDRMREGVYTFEFLKK